MDTADPQATESILGAGTSTATARSASPQLAAWTMLANVLLNLDETITKG